MLRYAVKKHPDAYIGDILTVHLYDENGQEIEKEGVLIEVLD